MGWLLSNVTRKSSIFTFYQVLLYMMGTVPCSGNAYISCYIFHHQKHHKNLKFLALYHGYCLTFILSPDLFLWDLNRGQPPCTVHRGAFAMALAVVSLLCLVSTAASLNVPLATFDGSKNTTFEFKDQKREVIVKGILAGPPPKLPSPGIRG